MARKMRTGPRRVSQADVARHAGVSTGIVSSVINARDYGSIRVSDATRERVLAAVRELGYIPDIAARNLARGSNRLIGVFTWEAMFPIGSQNFYHEFLVGIEEAADQAEYHLLLVTGAKNEDRRRSIYAGGVNHLRLADGGLLLGTNEITDEIVRLAGESYPFVFVGEREFPGVELSYVAGDYVEGTAGLVGRAVDLGHRRIAMGLTQEHEPIPDARPVSGWPGSGTGWPRTTLRCCRSGSSRTGARTGSPRTRSWTRSPGAGSPRSSWRTTASPSRSAPRPSGAASGSLATSPWSG